MSTSKYNERVKVPSGQLYKIRNGAEDRKEQKIGSVLFSRNETAIGVESSDCNGPVLSEHKWYDLQFDIYRRVFLFSSLLRRGSLEK